MIDGNTSGWRRYQRRNNARVSATDGSRSSFSERRRAIQVQAEANARAQQMIEDARLHARRIIAEGTRKALGYMAAEVANKTVQ